MLSITSYKPVGVPRFSENHYFMDEDRYTDQIYPVRRSYVKWILHIYIYVIQVVISVGVMTFLHW